MRDALVVGGSLPTTPAPRATRLRAQGWKPGNWEIAFIVITPRNLKEDTHRYEIRCYNNKVVGQEAPSGV